MSDLIPWLQNRAEDMRIAKSPYWADRLDEAAAELSRLTAEVERLRAELRECNCPRPINTAKDESTAWCVDNGHCGCGRNVLLGVEKGHGYAAIKEAGNG